LLYFHPMKKLIVSILLLGPSLSGATLSYLMPLKCTVASVEFQNMRRLLDPGDVVVDSRGRAGAFALTKFVDFDLQGRPIRARIPLSILNRRTHRVVPLFSSQPMAFTGGDRNSLHFSSTTDAAGSSVLSIMQTDSSTVNFVLDETDGYCARKVALNCHTSGGAPDLAEFSITAQEQASGTRSE
jgi:hypothetical protein